jgi:sec-independent protein translocase protein TatB
MSFSETVFLFLLALIIFGPKKLPEIARMVGKTLNEFRRASNEFKMQIEQEIAHLEVTEKQNILPPSAPPENTTSRSLGGGASQPISPEVSASPSVAQSADDEPLFATEAAAGATTMDKPTPPVATEALTPEAVTSSTSQESHA